MPSGKLALTTLLLTLPAVASAQQLAFAQYNAPVGGMQAITVGPDGALWFTQPNQIGRISTAGVIAEYAIADFEQGSAGITAGPDGAVWFTEENANKIGRISMSGTITEYPVPTARSFPWGITSGRDGALWFTEPGANQIGRITTAGMISEYPIPVSDYYGQALAIVAGPDGALWFTHGSYIVRITTPGSTTVYSAPIQTTFPSIAVGPDGALWFNGYCSVGRITTAGAITAYPVPGCTNGTDNWSLGITAGANGTMWFTGGSTTAGLPPSTWIGRITNDGVITEYGIPIVTRGLNTVSGPGAITVGPDGELWFTDSLGIGEGFFVTAELTASPDNGFYQTSHTFTGSGFAPNETVHIFARGVGSAVLATATADSTGSFSVPGRVPMAPAGPRVFIGVGLTSHKLGAANFIITPRLVLNPSSGRGGSAATAEGYGFPPFSRVQIYWSDPSTLLGAVTTDINGTFATSAAVKLTVPTGASIGPNRLIGVWHCTSVNPITCPDSGFGSFTVE